MDIYVTNVKTNDEMTRFQETMICVDVSYFENRSDKDTYATVHVFLPQGEYTLDQLKTLALTEAEKFLRRGIAAHRSQCSAPPP
jgi:hypothetical protein